MTIRKSYFPKACKRISFVFLILLLIFVAVESFVRVRYYLKAHEKRYLTWGLTGAGNTDKDFDEGERVDIPKEAVPKTNVTRIIVFETPRTIETGPGGISTWHNKLEHKLNRMYAPRKFEVLYGGIYHTGTGVQRIRNVLTHLLKSYQYHIGILYVGYNDLRSMFNRGECNPREIPRFVRILNLISNRALSFLVLREKVSVWAGQRMGDVYDRDFGWGKEEKSCTSEDLKRLRENLLKNAEAFRKFAPSYLAEYASELKKLIITGKSKGMKFLYVRQVLRGKKDPLSKHMPTIWEVTDRVLQPLNVPTFNMNSYFQSINRRGELFRTTVRAVDLSDRGTDALADGMLSALKNLGWVSAK